MDARELHRRISKAIGTKALARKFNLCPQSVYWWGEKNPDVRGMAPLEKVRLLIEELRAGGEMELLGEVLAFLSARTGFYVIRIIRSKKGECGNAMSKNRACQPKPTDPKNERQF